MTQHNDPHTNSDPKLDTSDSGAQKLDGKHNDGLSRILNDYTIHAAHPLKCKDNKYMVAELKSRLTAHIRQLITEARLEELQSYFTKFNNGDWKAMDTIVYCENRIAALTAQLEGDKP